MNDEIKAFAETYDALRQNDPERETAGAIIAAEQERSHDERIKAMRDLSARICTLRSYHLSDSARSDYRANDKHRRAVMIAERELRLAVLAAAV